MPDEQVLAVQARLVQDHPHVKDVAWMCNGGVDAHGVNQLTAAMMYVACGCRIVRCRKVVEQARAALRGHPGAPSSSWSRQTERHRERYRQALLENVLVLAKRTTAGRPRKEREGHA